jgi:glycogen debranching enzyme
MRAAARSVLVENWREGVARDGTPYAYTTPDARYYRHQWLWDSLVHALAWSVLEPARARRELRTLVRAQDRRGAIPHTIAWDGRLRLYQRFGYSTPTFWGTRTATIQPPFLGLAWAEVADRSPEDPGFAEEGRRAIVAYHGWLEEHRADRDGLLGVITPDETGLDASPVFDQALGRRAHGRIGYVALVRAGRRRGFSWRRAVAEGGFHAVCPLVNTAWALSWLGLARLGQAGAAERAREITKALEARLWDERRGFFLTEGPRGERIGVAGWQGMAPIALPDLDADKAGRVVDEHLTNPRRFWPRYPVPSVSLEEPTFRPGTTGRVMSRYWRGPTWPFTPVFLVPGLLRHGYPGPARELVARQEELLLRTGFREYHNPLTGEGHGVRRFSCQAGVVWTRDQVERAAPPAA